MRSTTGRPIPLINDHQEFAQLTPENIVYKQVGPVLVKQDQAEAKQNVETRLQFIGGEMCVVSNRDIVQSRLTGSQGNAWKPS